MPQQVGPFRILHQLGAGVLGPVFRAHDASADRLIAIKLFRLDFTPEQAGELADRLARLPQVLPRHARIVAPVAAGVEGSLPWLAEEYVAADALDARLRRRATGGLRHALPILEQIAGAIDAAAGAGVHHGALHPRDVLVSTRGEVRVTGFGVADAVETVGGRSAARRPYAAPERTAGEAGSTAADVFALGVLAFELLTGRRPVGLGATAAGLVSGVGEGIDPDVCRSALARALGELPGTRFHSAGAFIAALAGALEDDHPPSHRRRAPAGTVPAQARLADDTPVESWDPKTRKMPWPNASGTAGPQESPEADTAIVRSEQVDVDPDLGPMLISVDDELPREWRDLEGPVASASLARAPLATADDFDAAIRVEETDRPVVETAPLVSVPDVREADALDPAARGGEPERNVPDVLEMSDTLGGTDALDTWSVVPHRGETSLDEGDEPPAGARNERSTDSPSALEPLSLHAGEAVEPPSPVGSEPALFSGSSSQEPSGSGGWRGLAVGLVVGVAIGLLGGYYVRGRLATGETPASTARQEEAVASSERVWSEEPIAGDGRPQTAGEAGPRQSSPAHASVTPPAGGSNREQPRPTPAADTPVRAVGRLLVRSTPAGAEVAINGRRHGVTPLALRALDPGAYDVVVSRPGFRTESRRVTITRAHPAASLIVRLRDASGPGRAADPSGRGSMDVVSRPAGARVLLDGRPVGETPLRLTDVPAGRHGVRLELDGFAPWATTIELASGRAGRVSASLERAPNR